MTAPVLFKQQNRLCLGIPDQPDAGVLTVDFFDPAILHRISRSLSSESIVKAMGSRPKNADPHPFANSTDFTDRNSHLIDATAGLGLDAFILACAGWQVTMIEQSAIIHALLADGLERASTTAKALGNELVSAAIRRMFLMPVCDSKLVLRELPDAAVIYLDPMFPDRQKTARVKKSRFLLQQLHGAEAEGQNLLELALKLAPKIVVKRPILATPLDNIKPTGSISGKTARFDIYAGRPATSTDV